MLIWICSLFPIVSIKQLQPEFRRFIFLVKIRNFYSSYFVCGIFIQQNYVTINMVVKMDIKCQRPRTVFKFIGHFLYQFVFSFSCMLLFPFQKAMPLGSNIILLHIIIFSCLFLSLYMLNIHVLIVNIKRIRLKTLILLFK